MATQLGVSRSEPFRRAVDDLLSRYEELLDQRRAAAANRLPPERQAT